MNSISVHSASILFQSLAKMVQLVRSGSLKDKASSMFKRMGLGAKDDSSTLSSIGSSTADSETFISGLTEDIPDMRDDSVQLKIPQPKAPPPLPPKPKPLKMDFRAKKKPPAQTTREQPNQLPQPQLLQQPKPEPIVQPADPRTPPPSVITALKSVSSSKPETVTVTKRAPTTLQLTPAASIHEPDSPTKGFECVDFIVPELDSIPQLLIEEVLNENSSVVEDAVDRLARRCRKSDEMRDEAYRAGGHAVLVMAMRRWRENETIQAGGLRCITNMTCQFPEAKKSFAAVGGVESAIVAMQEYPDSLQVQGYACGALMNILCGHKDDTSDAALTIADRFVNHLNGIPIVVKAMTSFPDDSKIQLGGCGLFQKLADNKAYIYTMMQEGAVAAVGASLTSHPSDPSIKKAAGSFMKKVFA